MTINLVNESKVINNADAFTIAHALTLFSNQVCAAWQLPNNPIAYSNMRTNGWNICIVDKFPNPAMEGIALGYHEILNGQPIGYIKAQPYGSSRSPLGRYIKLISFAGKTIMPAKYLPGLVTVMAHELAEMLIDPTIDKYKPDSQQRNWLMEVCDHTVGLYIIPVLTYNVNPVFPDFTWPSFYNVIGKAPYSQLNVPPAPFYLVKGAYGYYKDATGVHKV